MTYGELEQRPTMTVGELIRELSKYEPDTRVAIFSDLAAHDVDEVTDDLEYEGDDVGAHRIKAIHDSWHFDSPHDTVCIEISRNMFIR